jgi:hypothetical protein
MARELLISCDRCRFERDVRSEGAPRTVGIDGSSFVLDLCEACDEEMLGVLRKLTADYGMPAEQVSSAPVAAPPRTTTKGPKPAPGKVVQTGTHRGTRYLGPQQAAAGYPTKCLWCPRDRMWNASDVGEHLRQDHGFESTYAAWGHDCPLCGKTGYGRLANHVLSAHKTDMNDAVRTALENNDPYGFGQIIFDRVDKRSLQAIPSRAAVPQ